MATASPRRPLAAKRTAAPRVWQLLVLDALRTWAVPGVAVAAILVAAALCLLAALVSAWLREEPA